MASIKLQYDRLNAAASAAGGGVTPNTTNDISAQKKLLEERAGSIKIKYQKILDLRDENQAKIAVQPQPVTFQPHPPEGAMGQEIVYGKPPPHPLMVASAVAAGDQQSHRRAVSDPSAIIEYQQGQMSNSRTIASGKMSRNWQENESNCVSTEVSENRLENPHELSHPLLCYLHIHYRRFRLIERIPSPKTDMDA